MNRRFSLLTLLSLAALCGLVGLYLGSQRTSAQPGSSEHSSPEPHTISKGNTRHLWEPPGNVADLLNDAQARGGTFGDIAVLRLLAAFEAKDAQSVLSWVMSHGHDNELSFDAQNIFWTHWASIETNSAMQAALDQNIAIYFVEEMVKVNLPEGLNFLCDHLDQSGFSDCLSSQIQSWATHDAPAATQWALTVTNSGPRTLALSEIAKAVAQNLSGYSALRWWDKLPTDETRREAFDGMITAFRDKEAKIELDDRVQLLHEGLKLGVRNRGFEVLLSYWLAYSKPAEGADILNAIPPETNPGRTIEDRQDAPMINLMRVWGKVESEEAGEWLLRLNSASIHRDEAITGYVLAIADEDTNAARRWLELISDQLLRQLATQAIGHPPK